MRAVALAVLVFLAVLWIFANILEDAGRKKAAEKLAVVWLVLFVVAAGLGVIVGIRALTYERSQHNCVRWGEVTEREVKWVDINYWDFGCYTRTDDGWVERGKVVKVEELTGS